MPRATIQPNRSGKSFTAEFRHPLLTDRGTQKPGRKVRKGLGTGDKAVAAKLGEQLNSLLSDISLHSPAMRHKAEEKFDLRVVEIFFDGLQPHPTLHRELRDSEIPFPKKGSGTPHILFMGSPGAGKTTLLRQMIGTDPKTEKFPATDVNRTTTFDTEILMGSENFTAAISFLSEDEVIFVLSSRVSEAVVAALVGKKVDAVANTFLEPSDKRFRLKYLIGDWESEDESNDPYAEKSTKGEATDHDSTNDELTRYIGKILQIADEAKKSIDQFDHLLSNGTSLESERAIDAAQSSAESSADFLNLVSELTDRIRSKFEEASVGEFRKSNTGWPRLWKHECSPNERARFFQTLRHFCGNQPSLWGRLLTPLVNGVRVSGPFRPSWHNSTQSPMAVIVDTEGVGHKANSSTDLPEGLVSRFSESDAIVVMHRGTDSITHSHGKIFEAIVTAGQIEKTSLVFSWMDKFEGEGTTRWSDKCQHAFSGVKDIAQGQISKSLGRNEASSLLNRLDDNSYYLGELDIGAQNNEPHRHRIDLERLFNSLIDSGRLQQVFSTRPVYEFDKFSLFVRDAMNAFRSQWHAHLGLVQNEDHDTLPWQSVRAVSRRFSERLDDGYPIRPTSNLRHQLATAVSLFLDTPTKWEVSITNEERLKIIHSIKEFATSMIIELCNRRIRDDRHGEWQSAYALRGEGSTIDRRATVEAIFAKGAPIPSSRPEDSVQTDALIGELKEIVLKAIDLAVGKK